MPRHPYMPHLPPENVKFNSPENAPIDRYGRLVLVQARQTMTGNMVNNLPRPWQVINRPFTPLPPVQEATGNSQPVEAPPMGNQQEHAEEEIVEEEAEIVNEPDETPDQDDESDGESEGEFDENRDARLIEKDEELKEEEEVERRRIERTIETAIIENDIEYKSSEYKRPNISLISRCFSSIVTTAACFCLRTFRYLDWRVMRKFDIKDSHWDGYKLFDASKLNLNLLTNPKTNLLFYTSMKNPRQPELYTGGLKTMDMFLLAATAMFGYVVVKKALDHYIPPEPQFGFQRVITPNPRRIEELRSMWWPFRFFWKSMKIDEIHFDVGRQRRMTCCGAVVNMGNRPCRCNTDMRHLS